MISRISRAPCLACGEDTLHVQLKCQRCGNQRITDEQYMKIAVARLDKPGKWCKARLLRARPSLQYRVRNAVRRMKM